MGSRRAEQLSLRSQQRIVATVEDSVLRTEMVDLESQEDDDPIIFDRVICLFLIENKNRGGKKS